MKTRFLLAVTAASLMGMAGCTKNDQLDSTTSKEVGFSTYVNANTKGLAKTEFKVGDKFAVMATQSLNAWTPDDATWFMGGGTDKFITVTNTPSSAGASLWKYNPVVLWPEAEKVSFFAFSPAPTAAEDYGITAVDATKGSPTLKFAVNSDITKQVDLLRAEAFDKFEEEIQLQFGHALTKVSFAAKANVTANQRVRLDAIKLVGIKNTGDFQLYDKDRTPGALADMGGWSNQAGAVEFKPALTHEIVGEVPTTLTAMTAEDQTLFMIPQHFDTEDAKLEITYSYSHDGGKKWVNGSILPIILKETTEYWNPGKSYRYVLTLAPADVYEFTADIIKWDDQIDVKVDKVVSSTSLSPNPAAFVSTELVVNETRGEELGYTLTSGNKNWLTISDDANGKDATAVVKYNADGTVTKAYDPAKKWYLQTKPNITGKKRVGYVKLDREKMDSIRIDVIQESVSPFVNCVPASLENLSGSTTPSVYEVKGLLAPITTDTTYKIAASVDWLTFSMDGKNAGVKELTVTQTDAPISLFVHVADNKTFAIRSGDITFTVTPKSGTAIEVGKFKVSQNIAAANTYISVNGSDVIFDATRKPRSAMAGKVGALAHQGYNTGTDAGTSNYYTGGIYTAGVMKDKELSADLDIADIAYVQVVWQTMKDHGKGIDTYESALSFKSYNPVSLGTAFIKSVAYDKTTGLATVKTNGTGNALIAAYDAGGTILWNWQIWGTETAPQANVNPGNSANGSGKMFMDRNLGALAATTSKPSAEDAYKYFGTMYQWGRKEPFTSAGPQYTTTLGADNNSIPAAIFDKTGKWIQTSTETGNTKPIKSTKGGYEYIASAAPSTYILLTNPTTHYNGSNSVISSDPNTWTPYSAGITKSIYDPCPYGYRVPTNGSWSNWGSSHTQTWTAFAIDGGVAMQSSWWPASGYRNYSSAVLYFIGNLGWYWSASPSTANQAYNLYFNNSGSVYPSNKDYRSFGMAVRCVQE